MNQSTSTLQARIEFSVLAPGANIFCSVPEQKMRSRPPRLPAISEALDTRPTARQQPKAVAGPALRHKLMPTSLVPSAPRAAPTLRALAAAAEQADVDEQGEQHDEPAERRDLTGAAH